MVRPSTALMSSSTIALYNTYVNRAECKGPLNLYHAVPLLGGPTNCSYLTKFDLPDRCTSDVTVSFHFIFSLSTLTSHMHPITTSARCSSYRSMLKTSSHAADRYLEHVWHKKLAVLHSPGSTTGGACVSEESQLVPAGDQPGTASVTPRDAGLGCAAT